MLVETHVKKLGLAVLPVFVFFCCFLFVKISAVRLEAAECNGRVAMGGQETNSVQDYCDGWLNATSEFARFYPAAHSDPDADELVQKWYREQSWMFADGVSCEPETTKNIPRMSRDGLWSGWWSGFESKEVGWNADIERWVVYLESFTVTYASALIPDAEAQQDVDYICPVHHQSFIVYEVCGDPGRHWGDFDDDTEWSERVVEGPEPDRRTGSDSGLDFPCFVYPSNF